MNRITPADVERRFLSMREENIADADFMLRLAAQMKRDQQTARSFADLFADARRERDALAAKVSGWDLEALMDSRVLVPCDSMQTSDDEDNRPTLPEGLADTFWKATIEAQVLVIFCLVQEVNISSGKAAELMAYLGLVPEGKMYEAREVVGGLKPYYGRTLDETIAELRELGVKV